MIARIYSTGVDVRVDLGNTGRNWPDCGDQEQPGFPFLVNWRKGNAWDHALAWAKEHGATEVVYDRIGRKK